MFECLCLEHSWHRFFPCCPLWLHFIYPIYYFCICTGLEFDLLLLGWGFAPQPTRLRLYLSVCDWKISLTLCSLPASEASVFSPPPRSLFLPGLDWALPRHLCSRSWLFARLSTLARVTAFSMPEVITKMFSLLCLCTSIVTPLIILNMGNCIFVERHVGQHSSGTGAGKQNFTLYLIKIKTSFICGKCRLGSSCPSLIFIHHWRPTFTCFIKGSCWTKNKPLTFQLRTKPIFWQILNNLKWKHTCILITPAFLMGLLEKSGSGLPVLTPSHTWMLMSFSST